MKQSFKANANYIRISPFKLRRVANLVRGRRASEAVSILSSLPHKGADIVKAVVVSAVANAKHNHGAVSSEFEITKLLINEGPRIKRVQPRARGRAFSIIKRTSHVVIEIQEVGGVI